MSYTDFIFLFIVCLSNLLHFLENDFNWLYIQAWILSCLHQKIGLLIKFWLIYGFFLSISAFVSIIFCNFAVKQILLSLVIILNIAIPFWSRGRRRGVINLHKYGRYKREIKQYPRTPISFRAVKRGWCWWQGMVELTL